MCDKEGKATVPLILSSLVLTMMTPLVVFGKNEGERETETQGNLEEISSSLEFKRAMLNSFRIRRMTFLIGNITRKGSVKIKF